MEPINWYGALHLAKRETRRFLKVYHQTIFTPAISGLLFLTIFVLATNNSEVNIGKIKFINFIGYGLIIMSIIQQSFANSSSSFIIAKILGYITDILVPPLGSFEIIFAFTLGAVLRGVIVGIAVALIFVPFIDYQLHHPILLVLYVLLTCTLMSQLGLFAALIAESFDQLAAVTSYLITPLSFLSGTFYSVKSLPEFFQAINLFNPFFYITDGFRYSITNQADGNVIAGISLLVTFNIIIFIVLYKLIDKGWRIKP